MKCNYCVLALFLSAIGAFAVNPDPKPSPTPEPTPTPDSCGNKDEAKAESIGYSLPVGGIPFEPGLEFAALRLHEESPSPNVFSPLALFLDHPTSYKFVLGVSYNPDAIFSPEGTKTTFSYPYGSNSGFATGGKSVADKKTIRLDSARNPIASGTPAYVRYWVTPLSWIEFDVPTGNPSRFKSESGHETVFASVPTEVSLVQIRKGGALRQIKNYSGLVDIIVLPLPDEGFEVRFYARSAVGSFDSATGLYTTTGAAYRTFRISNPDPGRTYATASITDTSGSVVEQKVFDFKQDVGQWTLREGAGAVKRDQSVATVSGPLSNQYTTSKVVNDGQGRMISSVSDVYQKGFPWGTDRIASIKEPATLALKTTYDYFTTGTAVSKIKQTVYPDGYWESFDYDASKRPLRKSTPWKDSAPTNLATAASRVITYAYTSNDASDVVASDDFRARVETESVITADNAAAQAVRKVYRAYFIDASSQATEIEELAATPTAGYGAAGNKRTKKVYYTQNSAQAGYDAVSAGRLKYQETSDGLRTTYSYVRNAANLSAYFTQTEIYATSASPAGVDGLSTKMDRVYEVGGQLVSTQSYIYSGSAWNATQSDSQTVNELGQVTATAANGRTTSISTYAGKLRDTQTNEDGVVTEYTYDSLQRVFTEKRQTVAVSGSYAAQPAVLKTYDRGLGGLSCSCDGSVVETVTAGSLSLVSERQVDPAGRVILEKDTKGLQTTYSYASGGASVTRTLPGTGTEVTTKFRDRRISSISGTGVDAQSYDYGVNTDGSQWTKVTLPAGYTITTTDMLGRVIKEERPAQDGGVITRKYTYQTNGWLKSVTLSHVQGATVTSLSADTLYEYNVLGDRIREGLDVDASGTLVLASNDRIVDTNPSFLNTEGGWWRNVATIVYPVANSAAAVIVGQSRERLSGFGATVVSESASTDIYGNLTRSKREVNSSTKLRTETTTLPTSAQSAVRISYAERLVAETFVDRSGTMTYGYDDLGRVTSIQDPRLGAPQTIQYKVGSDLVASVKDAALNQTTLAFYPTGSAGAGQVSVVQDAAGNTTRYQYDARGRVLYTWGKATEPKAYTYAANGSLATLTTFRSTGAADLDAAAWPSLTGGDVTTWNYSGTTGLLSNKRYADNNGPDYGYDKANRILTRTWARSVASVRVATTYGYDAVTGERKTIIYSDGTAGVTYTFDRLGRVATVTDANGTTTLGYNPSTMELSTETLPAPIGTRVLTHQYEVTGAGKVAGRDAGILLGTVATPAQDLTVTAGYDSLGRSTTFNSSLGNYTYGYLANSNRVGTLTGPKITTSWVMEPNRDLLSEVGHVVSGSSIAKFVYGNDSVGRRQSRVQSGSTVGTTSYDRWGYDTLGQVLEDKRFTGTNPANYATDTEQTAVRTQFTYDAIGNRKTSVASGNTRTYTSSVLNQYSLINNPVVSPSYDLDGNMLATGGTWYYDWDAENRMKVARDYSTSPLSGSKKIESTYDYLGRRIGKKVSTYSGSAWTVNSDLRFVYDGWNLVAELNAASSFAVVRSYVFGLDLSGTRQGAGGIGGLLAFKDAAASKSYSPYTDGNGNVMGWVNHSNGTVEAVFDYDPFGNLLSSTGVAKDATPFKFSSKYTDNESGLVYYGYRFYSPSLGRWPNRDPIGEKGGVNLYGFCANSSANFWDYLGLDGCSQEKSRYESQQRAVDALKKKIANLKAAIERGVRNILNNGKDKAPLPFDSSEGMSNAESVAGHVDELAVYADALTRNIKQLELQQKYLEAARKSYSECLDRDIKECKNKSDFYSAVSDAAELGEDVSTGVAVGSGIVVVGGAIYVGGTLLASLLPEVALAF